VNADGALVALCSHDEQGVVFVPVPAPPATEPTDPDDTADGSAPDSTDAEPATSTTTVPANTVPSGPGTGTTVPAEQGEAWLGLRLAATSDGQPGVAVQTVWADSPAAAAGFVVGQRIIAIDDELVHTSNDVAAILQEHRPGDLIVVTVSAAPTAAPGTATTAPAGSAPTTAPGSTAIATTAVPTTTASPTTAPATTTKPSTTVPSLTTTPGSQAPTTTAAATTTAPAAGSGSGSAPTTTTPAGPNLLRISVVLGVREPNV
jgi:membrane-associated protease RseP (regulator of RpoE activity)